MTPYACWFKHGCLLGGHDIQHPIDHAIEADGIAPTTNRERPKNNHPSSRLGRNVTRYIPSSSKTPHEAKKKRKSQWAARRILIVKKDTKKRTGNGIRECNVKLPSRKCQPKKKKKKEPK
jgi:hypothetical protein